MADAAERSALVGGHYTLGGILDTLAGILGHFQAVAAGALAQDLSCIAIGCAAVSRAVFESIG